MDSGTKKVLIAMAVIVLAILAVFPAAMVNSMAQREAEEKDVDIVKLQAQVAKLKGEIGLRSKPEEDVIKMFSEKIEKMAFNHQLEVRQLRSDLTRAQSQTVLTDLTPLQDFVNDTRKTVRTLQKQVHDLEAKKACSCSGLH